MSALLEEERPGKKRSLGNHDDAAALAGAEVYHGLYGLRLHERRVLLHAVVRYHVLFAKLPYVHLLCVLEESVHLAAVGPQCLLSFGLRGIGQGKCQYEQQKKYPFHGFNVYILTYEFRPDGMGVQPA